MSEIITKIDNTVTKYKMITAGDIIVAGVSGGADSMLLLNYLISVKSKFDIRIIVANVEHGIRGAESKNDTEFVRRFCEKNSVEFHCLEIDAVGGAKRAGIGVEEYSRNVRYEFFNSLGGTKIATAHNLSDNVETVIFRLARSSNVRRMKYAVIAAKTELILLLILRILTINTHETIFATSLYTILNTLIRHF